jgi:transposase-like protein
MCHQCFEEIHQQRIHRKSTNTNTTNAVESLNSTYRRLNRSRSVFPNETALLKALYLATMEATKKWTMPLRDWGKVLGELEIMYEDRFPE